MRPSSKVLLAVSALLAGCATPYATGDGPLSFDDQYTNACLAANNGACDVSISWGAAALGDAGRVRLFSESRIRGERAPRRPASVAKVRSGRVSIAVSVETDLALDEDQLTKAAARLAGALDAAFPEGRHGVRTLAIDWRLVARDAHVTDRSKVRVRDGAGALRFYTPTAYGQDPNVRPVDLGEATSLVAHETHHAFWGLRRIDREPRAHKRKLTPGAHLFGEAAAQLFGACVAFDAFGRTPRPSRGLTPVFDQDGGRPPTVGVLSDEALGLAVEIGRMTAPGTASWDNQRVGIWTMGGGVALTVWSELVGAREDITEGEPGADVFAAFCAGDHLTDYRRFVDHVATLAGDGREAENFPMPARVISAP